MNRILISLLAVVSAVVPFVVDSAIKGAALLALAGVVTLALTKFSAAIRHLVWVVALGTLVLLPILSASLPGWRILPAWAVVAGETAKVRVPEPAAAKDNAGNPIQLQSPQTLIAPVATAADETAAITQAIPSAASIPSSHRSCRPLPQLHRAGGRIGSAPLVCRGHFRFCSIVRRSLASPADGRPMCGRDRQSAHRGTRSSPRPDRRSAESEAFARFAPTIPVVFGVFRPRILLPPKRSSGTTVACRPYSFTNWRTSKGTMSASNGWPISPAPFIGLIRWSGSPPGGCVSSANGRVTISSSPAAYRASDYANHLLEVATRFVAGEWGHSCSVAMARPRGWKAGWSLF